MKKDKIMKAAIKLFAQKGYYGCSMQDIADAVDLTKATLYFYFKNKEELYLSILKEEFSLYRETLEKSIEVFRNEPLEKLLFEVFKIFINSPQKDNFLIWKSTRLMVISDDKGLGKAVKNIIMDSQKQLYQIFSSIISQKQWDLRPTHSQRFLRSYLLFIESVLDWRMLQPFGMKKDDNPRLLKELWNNFWNGSKFDEVKQ